MKSRRAPALSGFFRRWLHIANPRERNRQTFKGLVDSISKVGLKRPIAVSGGDGGELYPLVCGQGRLEAFIALGQKEIPAVIRDHTVEDRLLHSIIENLVRHQHRPLDLLQDIGAMRQRGYYCEMIAQKTGLTYGYVRQISQLQEAGEGRLINAVEAGRIPLNIAIEIARSDDISIQIDSSNAASPSATKRCVLVERMVVRMR